MEPSDRGAAVLWVDEFPGLASDGAALLAKSKYARTVVAETNFADAERRLRATRFDLVIAAAGGPGVPGAAFIRRVRELPGYGYTPVVATTTLPAEFSQALWSAGASAVFDKLDIFGVMSYLERACYEATMRREHEQRSPRRSRRLSTGMGWWAAVIILALSIAAAGAFNRYDLVVSNAGVFRIDKFSGQVEVFPFVAGAKAPAWFKGVPAH